MGIASQGEGTGKGSSGHQAPGVNMGSRREPTGVPQPGTSGSRPPWLGNGVTPKK